MAESSLLAASPTSAALARIVHDFTCILRAEVVGGLLDFVDGALRDIGGLVAGLLNTLGSRVQRVGALLLDLLALGRVGCALVWLAFHDDSFFSLLCSRTLKRSKFQKQRLRSNNCARIY